MRARGTWVCPPRRLSAPLALSHRGGQRTHKFKVFRPFRKCQDPVTYARILDLYTRGDRVLLSLSSRVRQGKETLTPLTTHQCLC